MGLANLIKCHRRCLQFVPQYSFTQKKGDHGKVLVVGGSFEYTGAPFFAAYAAMRAGADLTWIVCAEQAAAPIKSYAPGIIVHPLLKLSGKDYTAEAVEYSDSDKEYFEYTLRKLQPLIERADSIVIGPGLGRDKMVLDLAEKVIDISREEGIPVVIDGDALFLVAHKMQMLKGHDLAICTPNGAELSRMYNSAFGEAGGEENVEIRCRKVADYLQGPAILAKHEMETVSQSRDSNVEPVRDEQQNAGSVSRAAYSQSLQSITIQLPKPNVINVRSKTDQSPGEIVSGSNLSRSHEQADKPPVAQDNLSTDSGTRSFGHHTIPNLPRMCIEEILHSGSPKRMGGQGDVLAGVLGTALAWASRTLNRRQRGSERGNSQERSQTEWPLVDSAYLACTTTRLAANMTWLEKGRASSTMDVLHNVPRALETILLVQIRDD